MNASAHEDQRPLQYVLCYAGFRWSTPEFTLVVGILLFVFFSGALAGLIDIPKDPENPRWCYRRGQPCWKRDLAAMWGAPSKIDPQDTAGVKEALMESTCEKVQDLVELVNSPGQLFEELDVVATQRGSVDFDPQDTAEVKEALAESSCEQPRTLVEPEQRTSSVVLQARMQDSP